MFIELVDALRCPEKHSDTYLVAAPDEMAERNIIRGTLGCPVCGAEYRIDSGVVHFSRDRSLRSLGPAQLPSEYDVLRCGALLGLHGNGGFAILMGEWGALAEAMLDAVNVHLVLVNPPVSVPNREGLSIIVAGAGIPLAPSRAHGVAVDSGSLSRITLNAAAALVRSGGRLVAPAGSDLPVGARMLASDERDWVAEVNHAPLTTLSSRRACS